MVCCKDLLVGFKYTVYDKNDVFDTNDPRGVWGWRRCRWCDIWQREGIKCVQHHDTLVQLQSPITTTSTWIWATWIRTRIHFCRLCASNGFTDFQMVFCFFWQLLIPDNHSIDFGFRWTCLFFVLEITFRKEKCLVSLEFFDSCDCVWIYVESVVNRSANEMVLFCACTLISIVAQPTCQSNTSSAGENTSRGKQSILNLCFSFFSSSLQKKWNFSIENQPWMLESENKTIETFCEQNVRAQKHNRIPVKNLNGTHKTRCK